MPEAIVVGSGIAGPLAAIGLQQAGVRATVYEAYPEGAAWSAGAWLTVAVNGLAAMRALGVHDAVKAAGFPSEVIEFASGTGKYLGALPIGGRLSDGTVTHTMKRADLYRTVSRAAADRGIRFEYEKRFVSAESTDKGVVARFEDGTEARADFLIGADGVHSRVRAAIDPDAPRPRFIGLGDIGGFVPAGSTSLPPGRYCMVFGARCFFGYTVAPSGETWWFANPPRERELSHEALSSTDWRAHLLELFARDRGPMCDLIDRTPGTLVSTNQYDLPTVERWHAGRMLVLGDAAHAASPSSGQGVSMAAEDAVALAVCVREHADLDEALAAFVVARKSRAERVVAHGRRSASMKAPGPVGRVLRDFMLPMIFRRQARAGARELAWLYDHQLDWQPARAAGTAER
jgi:2-polyprenyl-6-methoxyphenol hydroxylase-like FAD-dependent oxidoreductase